ncbi:propanediol utilization: polyhedral bodies pduT [Clostridia bacterium]|nr:propanediol utilization: polyhedral bodies pduT [Clostridia bacterium]
MQNALGLLEIVSIPKGVESGDAMLKAASVELIEAHPVCAGKYIIVITGEVAAVKESLAAGKEVCGMKLVDSLIIPKVDPQVPRAIAMCNDFGEVQAVGSIETFSVCSCVLAADVAVKAAEVRLIEVRLARGLGGKGFIMMTGEVAAVESAIKAAQALDEVQGLMSESVVIAAPHPGIVRSLV